MPGGRGTILDIAGALNHDNHSEIAEAVKMAIDSGYRVSGTSTTMIGAAFALCDHTSDLTDVWCHAINHGSVDWAEY